MEKAAFEDRNSFDLSVGYILFGSIIPALFGNSSPMVPHCYKMVPPLRYPSRKNPYKPIGWYLTFKGSRKVPHFQVPYTGFVVQPSCIDYDNFDDVISKPHPLDII